MLLAVKPQELQSTESVDRHVEEREADRKFNLKFVSHAACLNVRWRAEDDGDIKID